MIRTGARRTCTPGRMLLSSAGAKATGRSVGTNCLRVRRALTWIGIYEVVVPCVLARKGVILRRTVDRGSDVCADDQNQGNQNHALSAGRTSFLHIGTGPREKRGPSSFLAPGSATAIGAQETRTTRQTPRDGRGRAFQRGPPPNMLFGTLWPAGLWHHFGTSPPDASDRPDSETKRTERTNRPHRPDFGDLPPGPTFRTKIGTILGGFSDAPTR